MCAMRRTPTSRSNHSTRRTPTSRSNHSTRRTRRTRLAGLGSLVLVVAVAATACGGDSDGSSGAAATPTPSASASEAPGDAASTGASSSASPSASVSASPSSYLPVPAGVTLSEQGSALAVGQPATVAWQPRQDTVGVLDVTVDRLERTTIAKSFTGWKIPDSTQSAAPYFVRATVTNRGDTDLSGRAVPLYAVDGAGTLVEATTFASVFKPCRGGVFPDAFTPGATAQVCLVYFVPDKGDLTGVSFRPTQEFNPITWTGELQKVKKSAGGAKASASASATP